MKRDEIRVGNRVTHTPNSGASYGSGTVIAINSYGTSNPSYFADVRFDSVGVKTISIDYLSKSQESSAKTTMGSFSSHSYGFGGVSVHEKKPCPFQIGNYVSHARWGKGEVISIANFPKISVRFLLGGNITVDQSVWHYDLKMIAEKAPEMARPTVKAQAPASAPIKTSQSVSVPMATRVSPSASEKAPASVAAPVKPPKQQTREEIITEEEVFEDVVDSALQVIPSNFSDQNCYSTISKRFVTHLRRQYPSGGFVSMKSYSEEDGGVIGVFVIPDQGIVVFKLIEKEIPLDLICSPLFETMANTEHYEPLKEYYINKFLQSKSLCHFVDGKGKILKYPFRFVLVYQNVALERKADADRIRKVLKNRDIYFKNFVTPFDNNTLFSNFEKHLMPFGSIPSDVHGLILERVIPENATLIRVMPNEKRTRTVSNSPEFRPITGEEREFSALCLDDSQIKAINDTKPGHYLTLANPGTGKSVLLVSKAYRIQSIKNDNHVLVTCYNKNLAEHHSTFAEISGLKTKNLHISTFHKLAWELLSSVDPSFVQQHDVHEEDEAFNLIIDRLEELVKRGKIQTKFNAIFIDEIQLFDPKWIDICYSLLDKEGGKPFYFEMFGDINQDVRSKRSKGIASWQKAKTLPSLAGRVKKLERNYRNTDLIANYLKCMIAEFNEYLNKHGIQIDPDSACMSSVTSRKGTIKTKVLVSPQTDVSKVIQVIEELVKKRNIEYNDIAIIYPAKGWGKWYSPVWNIKRMLEENDIPYSVIHGDQIAGDSRRQRLFECDGVIMSTVDSCLGLDFQYVILCGVHYWDFVYDEKTGRTQKIDKQKLLFDEGVRFLYSEAGKKIYSACSRARDGLFIFDDTDANSPIKDILRPASGRSYFDER